MKRSTAVSLRTYGLIFAAIGLVHGIWAWTHDSSIAFQLGTFTGGVVMLIVGMVMERRPGRL